MPFFAKQLITSEIIALKIFEIQTDDWIDLFQRTMFPVVPNIVKLFRKMSINNQLFSGIETNDVLVFDPHDRCAYEYYFLSRGIDIRL